jgi:hypothetical protein
MQKENILSFNKYKILHLLIFSIFVTSSFDIFLNLKVASFSLRVVLLLLLILIVTVIIMNRMLNFSIIGYKFLFPWVCMQFLFIPNTTFITRNILYFSWLIFYILLIMSFVSLIKSKPFFFSIFKIYIHSFYYTSIFGIIQFLLGLKGYNLLISQWWIEGILPRINGFSYEPSYFTTYLIIGWGICFYLNFTKKQHDLDKLINFKRILWVISITIILSTSRIGIAVICICFILTFFHNLIFRFSLKRILKIFSYILILCIGSILTIRKLNIDIEEYSFLLNGIGIMGSADHSTAGRADRASETFDIFLENPLVGVSLGGIPSAIASKYNLVITNQEQIKSTGYNGTEAGYSAGFEGQNIFAELIAASGIFGFPLIIIYLFLTFYLPYKLSNNRISKEDKYILRSLLFSGVLVFAMLFFNQNILRTWVWIHIAFINTFYFIVKNKTNENLH